MRRFVWALVALLAVVHYDFWYWGDASLVLGFVPIGLAYHAAYSLACGLTWLAVVYLAWPREVEEWAEATEPARPEGE